MASTGFFFWLAIGSLALWIEAHRQFYHPENRGSLTYGRYPVLSGVGVEEPSSSGPASVSLNSSDSVVMKQPVAGKAAPARSPTIINVSFESRMVFSRLGLSSLVLKKVGTFSRGVVRRGRTVASSPRCSSPPRPG